MAFLPKFSEDAKWNFEDHFFLQNNSSNKDNILNKQRFFKKNVLKRDVCLCIHCIPSRLLVLG